MEMIREKGDRIMRASIFGRFFRWNLSKSTLAAFLSEGVMLLIAYAGLNVFSPGSAIVLALKLLTTVLLCLVFPLCWMKFVEGRNMGSIGITLRRWPIASVFGIAIFVFSASVYSYGWRSELEIIPSMILGIYSPLEITFIYGWLQLRFEESFGIVPAILLAALSFLFYHFGYGWYMWIGYIGIFLIGLFMAIIFRISRNLISLWPVALLRGIKVTGFVAAWQTAVFWPVILIIMTVLIYFFSRIKPGRN